MTELLNPRLPTDVLPSTNSDSARVLLTLIGEPEGQFDALGELFPGRQVVVATPQLQELQALYTDQDGRVIIPSPPRAVVVATTPFGGDVGLVPSWREPILAMVDSASARAERNSRLGQLFSRAWRDGRKIERIAAQGRPMQDPVAYECLQLPPQLLTPAQHSEEAVEQWCQQTMARIRAEHPLFQLYDQLERVMPDKYQPKPFKPDMGIRKQVEARVEALFIAALGRPLPLRPDDIQFFLSPMNPAFCLVHILAEPAFQRDEFTAPAEARRLEEQEARREEERMRMIAENLRVDPVLAIPTGLEPVQLPTQVVASYHGIITALLQTMYGQVQKNGRLYPKQLDLAHLRAFYDRCLNLDSPTSPFYAILGHGVPLAQTAILQSLALSMAEFTNLVVVSALNRAAQTMWQAQADIKHWTNPSGIYPNGTVWHPEFGFVSPQSLIKKLTAAATSRVS